MIILQFKDSRSSKPRYLLVANTHIHWNPEHKDVKLIQVQLLLEQLSALASNPNGKWFNIPMVVCGDFNSAVGSGPYDLLGTGDLLPQHPDLHPFNYGLYSSQVKFPMLLSNAWAGNEPFSWIKFCLCSNWRTHIHQLYKWFCGCFGLPLVFTGDILGEYQVTELGCVGSVQSITTCGWGFCQTHKITKCLYEFRSYIHSIRILL